MSLKQRLQPLRDSYVLRHAVGSECGAFRSRPALRWHQQLVEQLVELHGVGQVGALEQRGVGVIVWLVLNAIIEAYAFVAQQYR